MSGREVAITGIGAVCASGADADSIIAAAREGRSGVRLGSDAGAPRLEPDPPDFEGRVPGRALRRLDATMRMALHAVLAAVGTARFDEIPPERRSVVTGTGFAGCDSSIRFLESVWEGGPGLANPSLFPNTVPNGPTGRLSIFLGARGPSTNFFESGTAGESAIAFAREAIVRGEAKVALVAGIDERSKPTVELERIFDRARWRGAPGDRLRPFDAGRTGPVRGAAAGALVLEDAAAARARGVEPLALISPVACGADTSWPGGWPRDVGALARVLKAAAGGEATGFVSASARGSREFDAFEAAAIREAGLAGPVTAFAGLSGDMDAGGVLRAALAVAALRAGFVPPVARLRRPDSAFAFTPVLAPIPIAAPSVLHVGSGGGGTHAAFRIARP